MLFCSTGIISTARIHLYLALLLHRDYFVPVKCISIWLFYSTGIISAVWIHLYLALLFHKDYFNRPDSSLSGFSIPQGLFRPPGFISIWLFCPTGIISAVQIHLYLAFLFHRDYFDRLNASLPGFSVPQRLFRPAECISIWLFYSAWIISADQMHLYLALLFHRDYFDRLNASISIWLFYSAGIISADQMHLYLALLFHRDYFDRLNASLSGFSVPQRLFQPPGFISIWLFYSTGIISAVWIHLYLALLFHMDYFGRPDSSLSGFSGIQLACKFYFPHSFRTNSRHKKKPETLKIQGFRPVEMTGIEPATSRLRTWRSPS